jgi:hypothetical protein
MKRRLLATTFALVAFAAFYAALADLTSGSAAPPPSASTHASSRHA